MAIVAQDNTRKGRPGNNYKMKSGKRIIKDTKVRLLLSLLLLLTYTGCLAGSEDYDFEKTDPRNLRFIFYNAENLFDNINDPERDDDAFTPESDRHWTRHRLRNKINNIYKALVAAAGFTVPSIIGLCEVENKYVLEILAYGTGFKYRNYKIISRDSPDNRGIDVAVLYRPEDITIIDTIFRSVVFPFDSLAKTRDIVYIKGITTGKDTLHIFVNHWPSRWGGQAVTEPYRIHTASVLQSMTDSIFMMDPDASVVIMGDFNDEPDDKSLSISLGAKLDYSFPEPGRLYNISSYPKSQVEGTIKYQGQWFLFDQFIVSGSLLNGRSAIQTSPCSARVFSEGFLLVPDDSWFGYKPFRTYEGFIYKGGFSDHLPVVLDLWW